MLVDKTCSRTACTTAMSFSPLIASGGGRQWGASPDVVSHPASSGKLAVWAPKFLTGQEVRVPRCDPTFLSYHPSGELGNMSLRILLAQPLLRKA